MNENKDPTIMFAYSAVVKLYEAKSSLLYILCESRNLLCIFKCAYLHTFLL